MLFSCKNISRIGIIDKATNTLEWRFGEPEISGQHHARFLPNGHIHLFDNGTRKAGLPASRVAEIDPKTDKVVWEYQANPPFSFFSPHISSADRLPNGNTFTSARASDGCSESPAGADSVGMAQPVQRDRAQRPGQHLALARPPLLAAAPCPGRARAQPGPLPGPERDVRPGLSQLAYLQLALGTSPSAQLALRLSRKARTPSCPSGLTRALAMRLAGLLHDPAIDLLAGDIGHQPLGLAHRVGRTGHDRLTETVGGRVQRVQIVHYLVDQADAWSLLGPRHPPARLQNRLRAFREPDGLHHVRLMVAAISPSLTSEKTKLASISAMAISQGPPPGLRPAA